jgi:hypothetical protein
MKLLRTARAMADFDDALIPIEIHPPQSPAGDFLPISQSRFKNATTSRGEFLPRWSACGIA